MRIIYLGMALLLAGCGAGFFSASTKAVYTISPDGKTITYESNKEQQGLSLDLSEQEGKITNLKIKVDKADTQQEAIAAALQAQLGLQQIIQQLLAAGAAGAGS